MAKKENKEIEKMETEDFKEMVEAIHEKVTEIKEIKKEEESEKEIKVKENEILLPTGVVKLKPTKLKYFKNGFYNNFMLVKTMGINEILRYDDGESVLYDYLCAALDIEKKEITYFDDLRTDTIFELIEKMNKINNIKDSDFLNQMISQEVKV